MRTTRETIKGYFDALAQKKDWGSLLADDIAFTSLTSPVKRVAGKEAYVISNDTLRVCFQIVVRGIGHGQDGPNVALRFVVERKRLDETLGFTRDVRCVE